MVTTLAKIATLAAGFGLSGSLAIAQGSYHGYEAPPYAVVWQSGPAELRDYAAYLVAEVSVQGERDSALGRGFSLLAAYIFGGNTASAQVAMTAPVAQTQPESIAMTVPVTQTGAEGRWTVSFMMPRQYTLATLPVPDSKAIRFVAVAADRQIVLTFSGRATDSALQMQEAALRAIAAAQGLRLTAGPFYYFYDDPFTLPWNRRNEVAFRVG